MSLVKGRERCSSAYHQENEVDQYDCLRLIYTSKVSGDGYGYGNVRCLRSCINQIKETEAEMDIDAKFGVLSPSRA